MIPLRNVESPRRSLRGGAQVALIVCALLAATTARGDELPIRLPRPQIDLPLNVRAERAHTWQEGAYTVWMLAGNCRIVQGEHVTTCREAVLWVEPKQASGEDADKVIAYLEGDVKISTPSARFADRSWFGRLYSREEVRVQVKEVFRDRATHTPLYARAAERFRPQTDAAQGDSARRKPEPVQTAQFQPPAEEIPAPAPGPPAGGIRIRALPRGDVPYQGDSFPTGRGDEHVTIITQGVNLLVDGVAIEGFGEVGTLDLSTDRMVIWSQGALDLSGQTRQDSQRRFEVYMEGNVVFRQGPREIYAERMYYDITSGIGVVLDAELFTPLPDLQGTVRMKADVIRQIARDQYYAQRAWVSTSLLARPTYRWQAGEITVYDGQQPAVDPLTGAPAINPETGEQVFVPQRQATAQNNSLFILGVPVFYWPSVTSNLEDPTLIINRVKVKQDDIFGIQVLTEWDLMEALGWNAPPGNEWRLNADIMTLRGPGLGTDYAYRFDQWLGVPGRGYGFGDIWGIKDTGLDNLGAGRRALLPDQEHRFRLFGRHRQWLWEEYRLSAEWGWISDRNFTEQYYESVWDEWKDQTTGIELWHAEENRSWSVNSDVRLNEFFTQTEWLPRGDFFWLGQSLLADTLTWHTHASLGYARLRTATPPEDPQELPTFALLPWEAPVQGERALVTSELDLPVQAGPVKAVPYILGQFAHWGEDLTANELQRGYFQGGLRASLPVWGLYPEAESHLFNVHGIAHKMTFEVDAYHAEASEPLSQLPLYDPLDDDSTEHFRRRFQFLTFGGMTPLRFDERYYALRNGLASWVTSPAPEIADDLDVVRMGIHQRWQTKRGLPGNRHIIDWVLFDVDTALYPDADRDNFGEELGLTTYHFEWHVGDRVTLLSDGAYDFFGTGQRVTTLGAFIDRPPRGQAYVGFRLLEGPIQSEVLTASYSYRMTDKWASSYGVSIDFGPQGNIGQRFSLIRIGESFLFNLGFTYNESKDVFGVNLLLEPRFLTSAGAGRIGGLPIPLAGANYLE